MSPGTPCNHRPWKNEGAQYQEDGTKKKCVITVPFMMTLTMIAAARRLDRVAREEIADFTPECYCVRRNGDFGIRITAPALCRGFITDKCPIDTGTTGI